MLQLLTPPHCTNLQVIKGWDCGIASMLKGEKAVFTIAPDYGYGAAGAGGVIPGNAVLLFEVELLEVSQLS
jgi:FKBP-type peptidyl-prolyl cis-trans isomerase